MTMPASMASLAGVTLDRGPAGAMGTSSQGFVPPEFRAGSDAGLDAGDSAIRIGHFSAQNKYFQGHRRWLGVVWQVRPATS